MNVRVVCLHHYVAAVIANANHKPVDRKTRGIFHLSENISRTRSGAASYSLEDAAGRSRQEMTYFIIALL